MPANLENSAVATGLEKVSFHFKPKERQCQRMLKLLHSGSEGKSVCLECGRPGFDPWVGKIPWRRKWQPPRVSTLAWKIPWAEEPCKLQSTGSQRVGRDWVTSLHFTSLLYWLCQSLGLCGSQQTVENTSVDGNTRPPSLPPEKSVCRSRSNS